MPLRAAAASAARRAWPRRSRELHERVQALELLGRHRREVHRVADDAVPAGSRGRRPRRRGRRAPAPPPSTPRCAAWRPRAANVASDQSVGGSFWNTSRPAPPTWPLARAAASAGSSISSPRAVLIDAHALLARRRSRAASKSLLVCLGDRQVQRDVVGSRAQRVEVDELDVELVGDVRGDERIVREIRMPKARARCATAWPMRPKPTTPSVLSRSSAPSRFFFSQRCCFIARVGASRPSAPARA